MIIYKYPVPINEVFFDIAMPYKAKILAFQLQNGEPVLWALVDTDTVGAMRHFAIRGTGTPMNDWRSTDTYIGTVQIPPFVWHLFETKG
jgi:hypothetical protein